MFTKVEILKLILEIITGGGLLTIFYKFWLKPLVDYKRLKTKIVHDLHFYANAIETPKHDCPLRTRAIEKEKVFRENAANLTAALSSLPFWFNFWLKYNFEKPKEAILPLQFIANADYDGCALEVAKQYSEVKKALLLE